MTENGDRAPRPERRSGVQSVGRAFAVLEAIADAGGEAGLTEVAAATQLPMPTIHRLVQTMVGLGYLRRDNGRRYILGPRLAHLGESAHLPLGRLARPYLNNLVNRAGETANLAMLDGDLIIYIAQVPSPHSMRMFTEVGRRLLPHATGVGKAILAQRPEDEVVQTLRRTGMPASTPHTITTVERFLAELRDIKARGYATDNGEQELAVRCLAVAVPQDPVRFAMSISGPDSRITDEVVAEMAPELSKQAAKLGAALDVPAEFGL